MTKAARRTTSKTKDQVHRTSPGERERQDQLLNEALIESFPASDPVAIRIERPSVQSNRSPKRPRQA
jgi:hypothetical protein